MNNLKKTLALVLAVAVVFTMGIATSFAAFTDVPSTVNYAEAVNILANLGIFTGYEDGSFKPDNTITRAEVATIIVRALNLGETKGSTAFTDVPADHWAAGYINTAAQRGVINGMGDGTFAPGADVTYEQVVKMIVAALNYEIVANQKGGYPTGYLTIAASNGITSGAAGTVGQPATRATVAKLLYNALEVGMVEQSTYTLSGDGEYTIGDDTLLSNMGVEKLEVVVADSYLTSDDDYDPKDKGVKLVAAKNYKQDDDSKSDYVADGVNKGEQIGDGTFNEGGTAAASLLGFACVAYVGVDDETGEDTIFAISAKGSKNSVTTVKGDMFAVDEAEKDTKVYYWKNSKTDKKASTLTPSTGTNGNNDVVVFTNFDKDGDLAGDSTTEDYDKVLSSGGVAKFIDNDSDGEFEYVIATKYDAECVVDKVEEEDGVWVISAMSGDDLDEYDPEDEDVLKQFIKGENYINVTEIAEGDTITTVKNNNEDIILYYVSSDKVTGTCKSWDPDDEIAEIDGKEYGLSVISEISLDDVKSKEGTFYLNYDGLISYVDGSVAIGGDYGYITGIDQDTKYSTTSYTIQIVDAKGNVNEYNLASKVSIYGATDEKSLTKATAYERISELIDEDVMNRVVRYTASSTTLSKIVTCKNDEFTGTKISENKSYDAEDMSIGAASFGTSTVIFALDDVDVTDPDDLGDSSNVKVGTASSFLKDEQSYTGYYYGDSDVAEVALLINPETAIDSEQNVFVVSEAKLTTENDEDAVKVSGVQAGKTRSFLIYDEDDANVAGEFIDDDYTTLVKGCVLLLGDESNGCVTDVEVLVQTQKDGTKISTTTPDEGEDFVSYEKDSKGNGIVMGIADIDVEATKKLTSNSRVAIVGWSDYEVIYSGSKIDKVTGGYAPSSGTKITLVDCTNTRLTGVEVSGNKSVSALRYSSSYAGCVFFRMYDVDSDANDLQTERASVLDLVAYKYNADDYESTVSDITANRGEDEEDEELISSEEILEEDTSVQDADEIVADDDDVDIEIDDQVL